MVGVTIATPIQSVKTQFKDGNTIYVASKEHFDKVTDKITEEAAEELKQEFTQNLIRSIKKELNSLPPSKYFGMYKYMSGVVDPRSLRQQISDSIKFRRDGAGNFIVTIDHPLAIALNDGTGIYGPNKQPITPKKGKYMFIPGPIYGANYLRMQYKKKGLSKIDTESRVAFWQGRLSVGKASQYKIKQKMVARNKLFKTTTRIP